MRETTKINFNEENIKDNLKEICKKLEKNSYITIVGPSLQETIKLRVYYKGGLLGQINPFKKSTAKTDLMTQDYIKHIDDKEKKQKIKALYSKKEVNHDLILVNNDYLSNAKIAFEKKWIKEKNGSKKEREVETRIVKEFKNANKNFSVIDMEFQIPSKWMELYEKPNKKGYTKAPKHDLVVISNEGVGIIELKVNNDSTNNLDNHYRHMEFILDNKDTIKEKIYEEMKFRVKVLTLCGLIDPKILEKFENEIKKDVWCGMLFVGGGEENIKKTCKAKLGNQSEKHRLKDIKFIYYDDTNNLKNLDLNNLITF